MSAACTLTSPSRGIRETIFHNYIQFTPVETGISILGSLTIPETLNNPTSITTNPPQEPDAPASNPERVAPFSSG